MEKETISKKGIVFGLVALAWTILFINAAGATTVYAGGTYNFTTNMTNPVYTVVGNSSDLEGLSVTFENNTIFVSPVLNFKPDNFTLFFFDNATREVEKIVYRGGGGGGGGGSSHRQIVNVTQNITVYVPEYIETTITKTEIIESIGYPYWAEVLVRIILVIEVIYVLYLLRRSLFRYKEGAYVRHIK